MPTLLNNPVLRTKAAPWLAMAAILAATAIELHHQGRLWRERERPVARCGSAMSGARRIRNNYFDPYSVTHVLHGFILCGLAAWALALAGRLAAAVLAVALEALWEMFENTKFVIDRYRQATAAVGYEGDTVVNSMGDILACGVGF